MFFFLLLLIFGGGGCVGAVGQIRRQVCVYWAFGQRGRTVELSGCPLPVLSKEREFRSHIKSHYEIRVSRKGLNVSLLQRLDVWRRIRDPR